MHNADTRESYFNAGKIDLINYKQKAQLSQRGRA